MAWISYAELLANEEKNRSAFGRMLQSWRRSNGWTQYTACDWAKEVGFDAISYGNLSVIEQGKAGELRQKAFWQLGELNRRIAEQQWGPIKTSLLKERVTAAKPLGDEECPVWSPLEFWACYCGLRPIPPAYQALPAPTIGQRRASELCGKWRTQMRRAVEAQGLDPADALDRLAAVAGPAHRKRWFSVLTGFGNYTPLELAQLWVEGDIYRPMQWLQEWQEDVEDGQAGAAALEAHRRSGEASCSLDEVMQGLETE